MVSQDAREVNTKYSKTVATDFFAVGDIPKRQRYQPSKYFGRNELPRLILEALRKAPGPLLTDEIARYAMHANGITPSAKESVIKPV
jgi:hypothetical protein